MNAHAGVGASGAVRPLSNLIGAVPDPVPAIGACQSFPRNSEIVAEGAPVESIFRVLSGAVRTVRLMEDGRRQIGAFYLPGEFFGVAARGTHAYAAEAVVATSVSAIRLEVLGATPAGAALLCETAVAELARAHDRFLTLGRRCAVERVASFLLDLAARASGRGAVELPMCRQDIGDFLGLTIETVSRTMTQLERSGVIAMQNSRRLILRDVVALARLEGC